MLSQRQLNLSISQRTVLVTCDMVRAALGVDADTVTAKVDAGELRWVWNVSTGAGAVRELRFWAKEIIEPATVARLSVFSALNLILGTERTRWRGVEIQHLLLVSRPQIFRLHKEGDLPGEIVSGTLWVARAALKRFLTSRLIEGRESRVESQEEKSC